MKRFTRLATALALSAAFTAIPAAASAQKGPPTFGSAYLGHWAGSTDWTGTEYDSENSSWDFRGDGSFVDNFGAPGVWAELSDGSIRFQFARDDGTEGSVYTGRIVGDTLLGTMTNGEISGVFALRR